MEKVKATSTTKFPKAIGPYSRCVTTEFHVLSRQLPVSPTCRNFIDGEIAEIECFLIAAQFNYQIFHQVLIKRQKR